MKADAKQAPTTGGLQGVVLRAPETVVTVDDKAARKEPAAVVGEAAKVPVGKLRRTMGISVKTPTTTAPAAVEQAPQEAPPLSQEQLAAYWAEMVAAMGAELPKLAEQLKDRELRQESDDMFVIVVNNSYLDAEIRPNLIRMLTYLRKKSGRPLLNCRVEVVYEEHEAVAYLPRDKYDAMVRTNPALENFRVLFPDVDY